MSRREDLVQVWEDMTRELYPDVEPFKLRTLACAFNRVKPGGFTLEQVGVTLDQWGDYITAGQRASLWGEWSYRTVWNSGRRLRLEVLAPPVIPNKRVPAVKTLSEYWPGTTPLFWPLGVSTAP